MLVGQVIPMVLEADGARERSFDIYSRLLRERIVFLGSVVDQESANRICAELLLLEAEDPDKDISLYINSPGGRDLYDADSFAEHGIELKFLAPFQGPADSILTLLLSQPAEAVAQMIRRESILIH